MTSSSDVPKSIQTSDVVRIGLVHYSDGSAREKVDLRVWCRNCEWTGRRTCTAPFTEQVTVKPCPRCGGAVGWSY